LETLPQSLVHFDCRRRNLLIQRSVDGQAELVVIDWAFCGVRALGVELRALVGGGTTCCEWPVLATDFIRAIPRHYRLCFNSTVRHNG
jgi:hypothetical protein